MGPVSGTIPVHRSTPGLIEVNRHGSFTTVEEIEAVFVRQWIEAGLENAEDQFLFLAAGLKAMIWAVESTVPVQPGPHGNFDAIARLLTGPQSSENAMAFAPAHSFGGSDRNVNFWVHSIRGELQFDDGYAAFFLDGNVRRNVRVSATPGVWKGQELQDLWEGVLAPVFPWADPLTLGLIASRMREATMAVQSATDDPYFGSADEVEDGRAWAELYTDLSGHLFDWKPSEGSED